MQPKKPIKIPEEVVEQTKKLTKLCLLNNIPFVIALQDELYDGRQEEALILQYSIFDTDSILLNKVVDIFEGTHVIEGMPLI